MVKALVVIDVQRGMFELPQKLHQGEEVVARLSRVLERARAQGVPIFPHESTGGFERNSPGWFHHAAVAPKAGETIIDKRRSSAFHETDFHARLQAEGIDHLVIGGMHTQFCVESTIRNAVTLGYKLTAIEDGHTTYDTDVLTARRSSRITSRSGAGALPNWCRLRRSALGRREIVRHEAAEIAGHGLRILANS